MRACFRSKWRLTRGSDRLRDGFYWFCPPDTPFYPGVHQLGSRDWTSDERDPPPELGEWEGNRSWYRGDPPARRPLPILIGNPDCIRYGEKPGLPIQTSGADAECGKPLPDACYGLEQTIFEKTNVFDCVFAKLAADVIDKAYTDLDEAAAIVLDYMPVGTIATTFAQPGVLIPAGVIASISDTVVLWLTGTTNFQQLAVQAFYAGTGPVNQGAYSTSNFNEAAMLAIAAVLNANGMGTAQRIVLCGHSFGGAVCMVLAARMMTADSNRNVEMLTLGSPAPGDARLHDLIATLAQRHYANQNDPVPYLPPRGLNFAALLPIIGPLLGAIWPRFVRPPQTKQISQDGTFKDVRTADLPDDLITIAAAAIAAGLDVPNFKNHRTDWYSYYLCLACKCVPRPCVPPDGALLGFDFILEGLRWLHEGVEQVEDFACNLTFNSSENTWTFEESATTRVLITVSLNELGDYDVFTVQYFPEDLGEFSRFFEWEFPADEMVLGIDTTSNPTFFSDDPGDELVGMGRLVIPSAAGFPEFDGAGDGGFDPIIDGEDLP